MKKVIALIITAIMLCTLFAACTDDKKDTGSKDESKPAVSQPAESVNESKEESSEVSKEESSEASKDESKEESSEASKDESKEESK